MSAERAEGAGLVPHETTDGSPGFIVKYGVRDDRMRLARLRQSAWASATWLSLTPPGHRPFKAWIVTLTYAPGRGWKPDDIKQATKDYRAWCALRGYPCRYCWFAEVQDGKRRVDGQGRGEVHYHLIAWLPVGVSMPHWDKLQRIGERTKRHLWPHGMSNTEELRTGVGYCMKYASKGNRLGYELPKGLRIFGAGGLCQQGRELRLWSTLPMWARLRHGVGELTRRAGRCVVRATGEVLQSPWLRVPVSGGVLLRCDEPLPTRWFGGPYSRVEFPALQVTA